MEGIQRQPPKRRPPAQEQRVPRAREIRAVSERWGIGGEGVAIQRHRYPLIETMLDLELEMYHMGECRGEMADYLG